MNEINSDLGLGLCIKDKEKRVIFQDQKCTHSCGDMQGQICNKGCMESYAALPGISLIKNSQVNDGTVDAVVINDREQLTTLLYYHQEKNNDDDKLMKARLISFGLTNGELAIFLRVLKGARNADIQKEFFISKATLKTHLNNIYKKLPDSFQIFKKRR